MHDLIQPDAYSSSILKIIQEKLLLFEGILIKESAAWLRAATLLFISRGIKIYTLPLPRY